MNYQMLRDILAARRRSFILLALLVLLDISLLVFLSAWQEPELVRTQNGWFARRQSAAQGVDRGVTARYRDAERDLALFQGRLIEKQNFAAFLSDLFATAKSNALGLKSITYKPSEVKEAGLTSYAIGFTLVGKYAGAKSFIADISRYPKIVVVDSVALGNSSRTEETVELKVSLTVFLKTEGA
jgi:type IV pilus assembly protein PilO